MIDLERAHGRSGQFSSALDLFCLCLDDWSDEAKEAGPKRREWLDRNEPRGLRAKLALDDDSAVGGMIQYRPIEHSFVDGTGLYFIYCIHVHGHKHGRGNFQKRGMGEPERIPGKVNVTAFCNGWCMAVNLVYERAKRAAAELGDPVVFREIDVSTREAVAE